MKCILFLLTLVLFNISYSQCNIQASICQQGTAGPFNFIPTNTSFAGGSFANAGCATGLGGNHSYGFITLYITQSGPLNLLINGNSNNGFIDVAIFNIPSGQNPCVAIQNGTNAIGCGFAQNAGGCIQFGNAFGCNSQFPAPNVVAGQQVMVIAQNWSNPGSSTFTLQLGPPPGAQTGPPNATINPSGPFCTTSPNTQLTAVNGGGTWSGPGVSSTGLFNPSLAGAGTHTITYSLGVSPCNSISTTTIIVTEPPTINIITTNVSCNGECDGVITVEPLNGATYLFVGGSIVGNGGNQNNVLTGVCPGNYTVTVTQNGCQSTGSVVITEPPIVVVGNISHN
jgi:hypothetical protein